MTHAPCDENIDSRINVSKWIPTKICEQNSCLASASRDVQQKKRTRILRCRVRYRRRSYPRLQLLDSFAVVVSSVFAVGELVTMVVVSIDDYDWEGRNPDDPIDLTDSDVKEMDEDIPANDPRENGCRFQEQEALISSLKDNSRVQEVKEDTPADDSPDEESRFQQQEVLINSLKNIENSRKRQSEPPTTPRDVKLARLDGSKKDLDCGAESSTERKVGRRDKEPGHNNAGCMITSPSPQKKEHLTAPVTTPNLARDETVKGRIKRLTLKYNGPKLSGDSERTPGPESNERNISSREMIHKRVWALYDIHSENHGDDDNASPNQDEALKAIADAKCDTKESQVPQEVDVIEESSMEMSARPASRDEGPFSSSSDNAEVEHKENVQESIVDSNPPILLPTQNDTVIDNIEGLKETGTTEVGRAESIEQPIVPSEFSLTKNATDNESIFNDAALETTMVLVNTPRKPSFSFARLLKVLFVLGASGFGCLYVRERLRVAAIKRDVRRQFKVE